MAASCRLAQHGPTATTAGKQTPALQRYYQWSRADGLKPSSCQPTPTRRTPAQQRFYQRFCADERLKAQQLDVHIDPGLQCASAAAVPRQQLKAQQLDVHTDPGLQGTSTAAALPAVLRRRLKAQQLDDYSDLGLPDTSAAAAKPAVPRRRLNVQQLEDHIDLKLQNVCAGRTLLPAVRNILQSKPVNGECKAPYRNPVMKKHRSIKVFQTLNHAKIIWDPLSKRRGLLGGHLNVRSTTPK